MAGKRRGRGRWLLLILLVAGAIVWWLRRTAAAPSPAPVPGEAPFQPFVPAASEPVAPVATAPTAPAAAAWVSPVDGDAPAGYPVKVAASGIFHVPGGRFYDRTRPERCYPDAASAVADGYRPSKA